MFWSVNWEGTGPSLTPFPPGQLQSCSQPLCCTDVALIPVFTTHSSQPGRAGLSLWQAQYRDLLFVAPDKRSLQGLGVAGSQGLFTPQVPQQALPWSWEGNLCVLQLVVGKKPLQQWLFWGWHPVVIHRGSHFALRTGVEVVLCRWARWLQPDSRSFNGSAFSELFGN